MFDLSLLIGLPKPNTIDTASLTPEDAAVKLRQAATLRLNGAQSILLHFPHDVELAVELLDDAAVLFDKAFRDLTGIPAQRVHQQIGEYVSVPSADRTSLGAANSPKLRISVFFSFLVIKNNIIYTYTCESIQFGYYFYFLVSAPGGVGVLLWLVPLILSELIGATLHEMNA